MHDKDKQLWELYKVILPTVTNSDDLSRDRRGYEYTKTLSYAKEALKIWDDRNRGVDNKH